MATPGNRQFAAASALPVQGHLLPSTAMVPKQKSLVGTKRKWVASAADPMQQDSGKRIQVDGVVTSESVATDTNTDALVKTLDRAWLRSILLFRATAPYVTFDSILSETKLELIRRLVSTLPLTQVLVLHSALSQDTTNFAIRVTCADCFRANKTVCQHSPSMPLDVFLPQTGELATVYVWNRSTFQWQHKTQEHLDVLALADHKHTQLVQKQILLQPEVTTDQLNCAIRDLPTGVTASSATILTILQEKQLEVANETIQANDKPTLTSLKQAYRILWHASDYGKKVLMKKAIQCQLLAPFHSGMWKALEKEMVWIVLAQEQYIRIAKKHAWLG